MMQQSSTLVIKNCDQTLRELIIDLESAYKSRMKLGMRINFSGGEEIKYHVENVENEKFFQLLKTHNKG